MKNSVKVCLVGITIVVLVLLISFTYAGKKNGGWFEVNKRTLYCSEAHMTDCGMYLRCNDLAEYICPHNIVKLNR